MVLEEQTTSRTLTFFAMVFALAAVASPYWGQISASDKTSEEVVSRGLYWSCSSTIKNASGVFYETAAWSDADCNETYRRFADSLIPFEYVSFCNGTGADGALWLTAFFGAMTVVLGLVSLVLDVRHSTSNLHIGSVGALFFSSILTLSVYSSAFPDAGLRSCASAARNTSFISGDAVVACRDFWMGWKVTYGDKKLLVSTGTSYLYELLAAAWAFLAFLYACIARLKLRAEGRGNAQLAKVDPSSTTPKPAGEMI